MEQQRIFPIVQLKLVSYNGMLYVLKETQMSIAVPATNTRNSELSLENDKIQDKNSSTNNNNVIAIASEGNKSSFQQRFLTFATCLCLIGTLIGSHSATKQPAQNKPSVMTMLTADVPPKVVPEGKTANEYYFLAFQYKLAGWAEQAREALNRAIKMDGDGPIGLNAKKFLLTRIPRYPVPGKAIVMNINARNTTRTANNPSARNKAESIWKQCIADYPKFEWPYGNLGELYVQEGKYKNAEELLNRAITINPNYANAWLHIAECKLKENDNAGAQASVDKALQLEPDDLGTQLTSLKIHIYGLFHK